MKKRTGGLVIPFRGYQIELVTLRSEKKNRPKNRVLVPCPF